MLLNKITNYSFILIIGIVFCFLLLFGTNYAHSQHMGEVDNLDNPKVIKEKEFYDIKDNFRTDNFQPDNPLALAPQDVMFIPVEEKGEKYIDIVVRKKKCVNSVLIINPRPGKDCHDMFSEQVRDFGTVDYGLRSLDFNEVNGEELRYHNGRYLGKKERLYFLIDSTPEKHPVFGEAYKIRVPLYVQYGYTWENFGLLRIEERMLLNIRTYERKHADYRGKFYNNCFQVDTSRYKKGDAQSFKLWEEKIQQITLNNQEFFVVNVRFTGHTKFFDFFTLKERKPSPSTINISPTRRVGYATKYDEIKDDACILLESIFKDGKKLVRAKIFIKKDTIERDIDLNMIDQDSVTCAKPLHYIIPAQGSNIPSIEPSNPKWNEETPLVRDDDKPLLTVNPEDRSGDVIEEDPRL